MGSSVSVLRFDQSHAGKDRASIHIDQSRAGKDEAFIDADKPWNGKDAIHANSAGRAEVCF